MTNCTKCGAELIGSRKFCAACGTPAVDPATLKRDASVAGPPSSPSPAPQINVPPTAYGPPGPASMNPVNPFAATASPSSRAIGSPYGPPPATTAQPPSNAPPGSQDATGPNAPVPPVSPLAVSNALSQRGAFQQAIGDAPPPSQPRTGTSPPPPQAGAPANAPAKKIPGTQLMPSIPNPSVPLPASVANPAPAPAAKQPMRTQLMDPKSFVRPTPSQPSAPSAASPPPPPAPMPPPPPAPPSVAAPAAPIVTPMHAPVPAAPYAAPPHAAPAAWNAWNPAPVAPVAPPQYGFGYAPGARVNVTWSNGQRYPATVSQVSGSQCLVVFPDGQQHWVEMQYLTPA